METLFTGKNVVFLPETESTNSHAINLLKNVNMAEGTVVYTTHQTQGRGQRGSAWISDPASNLAVSVVLKPAFLGAKKHFFLYIIAALAVHDTIAQLLNNGHFDIKIKWPNDILVNERKIAGILIENNFQNDRLNWTVIGVGININQAVFHGLPNAVSLRQLTDKENNITHVLKVFCESLERRYLSLKAGKYDALKDEYLQHFFRMNMAVNFEIKGEVAPMLVRGISESGLLLLGDDNGSEREFDVKEAVWIY